MFDISNQVKKQIDELNTKKKKEDSAAEDIRLDGSQADHLRDLENDLSRINDSVRRFMNDERDLERKGINTRVIIESIIKDIKSIFKV